MRNLTVRVTSLWDTFMKHPRRISHYSRDVMVNMHIYFGLGGFER